MKKNYRRVIGYLFLPVLFVLITFFLLKPAFSSVLNMVESKIIQALAEGNPSYRITYEPENWQQYGQGSKNGEEKTPAYGTWYGEIICERIGLKAPLYYGDDNELLQKGAGHYIGSVLPGKAGTTLVGGHDTSYFATLSELEAGDLIEVRTIHGVFHYEVTNSKIADAQEVSASDLKGEKDELILYTCYPFGVVWEDRPERYFVYCVGRE